MKVLIYAHAFAPMVGGAETLVMTLAQGLAERLNQKNEGGKDREEKGGVTVITPARRKEFDDASLPFRVVRRPSLWGLLRFIREADVVHLAGPCFIPLVFGLLLRKRIFIEHHGFQTICPNGLLFYGPTQIPCPGHFAKGRHYECLRCNSKRGRLYSVKIWLLTFPRRWLCYAASKNVAISGWLAKELMLPGTEVIYCGVPGSHCDVALQTPTSHPSIAFMGRLVSTKGAHVLLDAAHRLKTRGLPFHLKIIGEGPERLNLEAQANALNIADCVTFTGYLPGQALEQALKDVSVVVMPSLNGETFGLVAAENMIAGRLVIVSDIGVLSEVVGDAGLKFPPGDAEALSACLQNALENPELVAGLRERSRKRALGLFERERMIEDHLSLYGGVL